MTPSWIQGNSLTPPKRAGDSGLTALCRACRVTDDRVALDFNHPLAGEPLTLFIRVVRVAPPIRRMVGALR